MTKLSFLEFSNLTILCLGFGKSHVTSKVNLMPSWMSKWKSWSERWNITSNQDKANNMQKLSSRAFRVKNKIKKLKGGCQKFVSCIKLNKIEVIYYTNYDLSKIDLKHYISCYFNKTDVMFRPNIT